MEAREMFRSMDRDDNGFIDCQELMTSFAALGVPLTDEDVKAMLQEAGIKGQKIFFKDFLRIMSGRFGASLSHHNSFDSECSLSFDLASMGNQKSKTLTRQHAHVDWKMDNVEESEGGEKKERLEEEKDQEDEKKRKEEKLIQEENEEEDDDVAYLYGKHLEDTKHLTKAIQDQVETSHQLPDSSRFSPPQQQQQQQRASCAGAGSKLKIFRSSLPDKNNATSLEVQEFFRESISSEFTPSSLSNVFKGNTFHPNKNTNENSSKNSSNVSNKKNSNKTSANTPNVISTSEFSDNFPPCSLQKSLCNEALLKANLIDNSPQTASNLCVSIKSSAYHTEVVSNCPSQATVQLTHSVQQPCQQQQRPSQCQQQQRLPYHQQQLPPHPKQCLPHLSLQQQYSQQQQSQLLHSQSSQQPPQRRKSSIPKTPPPNTWVAFKIFDRNADGYITKNELWATMIELGIPVSKKDLESMMIEADINKDGKIDYAEFSKLMLGTFEVYAKEATKLTEKRNRSASTGRVLYRHPSPSHSNLPPKTIRDQRRSHHSSSPSYYCNSNGSAKGGQRACTSPTKQPSTTHPSHLLQTSSSPEASLQTDYFSSSHASQHSQKQQHYSQQQQSSQQKQNSQQLQKQKPQKQQQQYIVDQRLFQPPFKQSSNLQQTIQFSSFQPKSQKPPCPQTPQRDLQSTQQATQTPQSYSELGDTSEQRQDRVKIKTIQNPSNPFQPIVPPRPHPSNVCFQNATKEPAAFVNPAFSSPHHMQSAPQPRTTQQHEEPQNSETQHQTKSLHSTQPLQFQYPAPTPLASKQNCQQKTSNLFNNTTATNNNTITRTNSVEEEMRAAFKFFDIDGNGLIDASELKRTMHSLDELLSDQDVEAMILAVDKNGDGKVDYEEFIQLLRFTQMVDTG